MTLTAPAASLERHTLTAEERVFIDDFGAAWALAQTSRLEGRILALLIIRDSRGLTAVHIAKFLQTQRGPISAALKALCETGFVMRYTVQNDPRYYYGVEDDVWGTFLAGERTFLHRLGYVIRVGLMTDAGAKPGPNKRLLNAERYMTWLESYHRKMVDDWRAHLEELDALDATTIAEKPSTIRE